MFSVYRRVDKGMLHEVPHTCPTVRPARSKDAYAHFVLVCVSVLLRPAHRVLSFSPISFSLGALSSSGFGCEISQFDLFVSIFAFEQ